MVAMTTVLSDATDVNGYTRTYRLAGHTVTAERIAIQRRKAAPNAEGVAEDHIKVIFGTSDASGNPLSSKISFEAVVRRPANGTSADVTSALAVFRDMIAGDEFTNLVDGQSWVGS
jgi:hypothetical protein